MKQMYHTFAQLKEHPTTDGLVLGRQESSLSKHEDQRSHPGTHVEAGRSCLCLQPQRWRQRQMDLGAHWPASLVSFRFSKSLHQGNKSKNDRKTFNLLLWVQHHKHGHLYLKTHVYTHIYILQTHHIYISHTLHIYISHTHITYAYHTHHKYTSHTHTPFALQCRLNFSIHFGENIQTTVFIKVKVNRIYGWIVCRM